MTRQAHLLQLRPDLPTLSKEVTPKSIEAFQNTVLRPLLKFQNPLSLSLLKTHPHFSAHTLDSEKLTRHINDICKEVRFKNQLIGMMIGLMTLSEFEHYSLNAKEYNKRILTMQTARFIDQLS